MVRKFCILCVYCIRNAAFWYVCDANEVQNGDKLVPNFAIFRLIKQTQFPATSQNISVNLKKALEDVVDHHAGNDGVDDSRGPLGDERKPHFGVIGVHIP